jgi:hypothetical protein
MRALLVLAAIVLLTGCGGGRAATDAPPELELALLDVWVGLDEAFAGLAGRAEEACDASFGTWFEDFGVRGLACAAAHVVAPTNFVARAPVAPFRSGPHTAIADRVRLDLSAPRDFGRYDPAFVTWVATNAIPGPKNAEVRALTQPVYDRRVRRLARTYWLTHADLEASGFPESLPAGPLADYAAFLDGAPAPDGDVHDAGEGFSVFAFTGLSEALLPQIGVPIGNAWTAKYEANTAYGFWIRRRLDGTLGAWHDGLRRLLQTYDAAWLAEA